MDVDNQKNQKNPSAATLGVLIQALGAYAQSIVDRIIALGGAIETG